MKKILLTCVISILLYSCSGITTEKDPFIGEWKISPESPELFIGEKWKDVTMIITKTETFHRVEMFNNGKSMGEIIKEFDEKKMEAYSKYQLSPDKHILSNIYSPSIMFVYNDASKTVQSTLYGCFFVKK